MNTDILPFDFTIPAPKVLTRQSVADWLRAQIKSGRYAFGSHFPGIKAIIAATDASYVTVSRALQILKSDGYIDCHAGIGTIVKCQYTKDHPRTKLVNVLIYEEEYNALQNKPSKNRISKLGVTNLFDITCKVFQAAGWQVRVLPISDTMAAVRNELYDSEAYTVFLCMRPYWNDLQSSLDYIRRRGVLVGEMSNYGDGVASVTCAEPYSVQLLMNHLREQGCRRIGMFSGNAMSRLSEARMATWRMECMKDGLSYSWCREHFFSASFARGDTSQVILHFADELAKSDSLKDMDALIGLGALNAVELSETLAKYGIRVPRDLKLGAFDNTPAATHGHPTITCIDPDVEAHARLALDILEDRWNGFDSPGMLHFVTPKLVVRESSLKNN